MGTFLHFLHFLHQDGAWGDNFPFLYSRLLR